MTSQTSVYGWNQATGGTYWYRISEPLRGMALHGWEVDSGRELTQEIADKYGIILTHILHDDQGSEAWRMLARRGQNKLIMDIDDDVWNFDPATDAYRYWTGERLLRLQNNMAMCDLITTPSPHLAGLIQEYFKLPVTVLPNYVPEWLTTHKPVQYRTKFVMGYQGARQHTVDLREIAQDVYLMLSRKRRASVHLWGELNPIGWPTGRVHRTPWNTDIPAYYRSLAMTIGLGPLADIPFNYAKSAIRAVEYAALGIPAMVTDVPVYRDFVHDGWTGWLIPMRESWLERLEWAYRCREQVMVMGQTARRLAREWTTEANAHKWIGAYSG